MNQLSLLQEPVNEEFTVDDWETPDEIAQLMAGLVLPTDRLIFEPAAGTGQIAKYLPNDDRVVCMEIKRSRYAIGSAKSKQVWRCGDFILQSPDPMFDLVITNPPFSLAIYFIEQGLEILDRSYEHARLVYLLPSDFFASVGHNRDFQRLDAHIAHEYKIVNRVAYLKSGKQVKGRQIYDTAFEIRPGKHGGNVTFWSQP